MHTRATHKRFVSARRVQLRFATHVFHVFETHRHGTLLAVVFRRVVLEPSRATAEQRPTLRQPRVSFVWAVFEVNEKRPDDVLRTVLSSDRFWAAPAWLFAASGREVPMRMTGWVRASWLASMRLPSDSVQCWSEFRVGFGVVQPRRQCVVASGLSSLPHAADSGPGLR